MTCRELAAYERFIRDTVPNHLHFKRPVYPPIAQAMRNEIQNRQLRGEWEDDSQDTD